MNERIKLLAEQAGLSEGVFTRHDGVPCDLKGYSMLPDEMQKFAQLIQKDIIEQCRDMFIVGSVSWNLLNEKLEYFDFGVEE